MQVGNLSRGQSRLSSPCFAFCQLRFLPSAHKLLPFEYDVDDETKLIKLNLIFKYPLF